MPCLEVEVNPPSIFAGMGGLSYAVAGGLSSPVAVRCTYGNEASLLMTGDGDNGSSGSFDGHDNSGENESGDIRSCDCDGNLGCAACGNNPLFDTVLMPKFPGSGMRDAIGSSCGSELLASKPSDRRMAMVRNQLDNLQKASRKHEPRDRYLNRNVRNGLPLFQVCPFRLVCCLIFTALSEQVSNHT